MHSDVQVQKSEDKRCELVPHSQASRWGQYGDLLRVVHLGSSRKLRNADNKMAVLGLGKSDAIFINCM